MYEQSIPHLLHALNSLDNLLKRAEAYCEAHKITPDAILKFRLFPDMFPFIRQVQLVTDFAKGCAARLSGQPVPSFPDEEESFADLHSRLAKTITFLSSVDKDAIAASANRQVTIKIGGNQELTMPGMQYFNGYVLPNFYFHMTTAYNILRHNGVPLGKKDFMGR